MDKTNPSHSTSKTDPSQITNTPTNSHKAAKTAILLGASAEASHAIKVAQNLGFKVIALDGDKNAAGLALADEAAVIDISDKDAALGFIASKIASGEQIACLLPAPVGRILDVVGHINDTFKLPGISLKSAQNSTDKYRFSQILSAQNLRNIKTILIPKELLAGLANSDSDSAKNGFHSAKPSSDSAKNSTKLNEILSQIPLPCIIKPRFGSGSKNCIFAKDRAAASEFLQKIAHLREDFLAEGILDGDEYSIDGAVIDGEVQITLLRHKELTPLPYRQPIMSFCVCQNEGQTNAQNDTANELINRVQNYATKVAKALKYGNCLLNMDLKINGDKISVIESAPRPSGHSLCSVFVPLATGVDMIELILRHFMGERVSFRPKIIKNLLMRFFDFEDKIATHVPPKSQIKSGCELLKWQCNITAGMALGRIKDGHSLIPRGYFIINGKNKEELKIKSDWALSQFKLMDIDPQNKRASR